MKTISVLNIGTGYAVLGIRPDLWLLGAVLLGSGLVLALSMYGEDGDG